MPVTIVRMLELDGGIVLDEVVLASWSGRFATGLAGACPFGTGKAERCVAIGTAAVFAVGFHVPERAGAVAITLVSARSDAVTLGAVADPVFSSGFGVGDDLGVLLAVLGVKSRSPDIRFGAHHHRGAAPVLRRVVAALARYQRTALGSGKALCFGGRQALGLAFALGAVTAGAEDAAGAAHAHPLLLEPCVEGVATELAAAALVLLDHPGVGVGAGVDLELAARLGFYGGVELFVGEYGRVEAPGGQAQRGGSKRHASDSELVEVGGEAVGVDGVHAIASFGRFFNLSVAFG